MDPNAPTIQEFTLFASANRANVANYSYGWWVDSYLDGSDEDDTILAWQADHGIVPVTIAGNLASKSRHFRGVDVHQNPAIEEHFTVPQSQPAITDVLQTLLWFSPPGTIDVTLQLTTPGGVSRELQAPIWGQRYQDLDFGGHQLVWEKARSGANTAKFYLQITNAAGVAQGNWTLTIAAAPGSASINALHGYIADSNWTWEGGAVYVERLDDAYTVTSPGTADPSKVIVVAAYDETTGGIRADSGRGPRIDGAKIVDLAAPGGQITAADSSVRQNQNGQTVGVYGGYDTGGGTSAAAPLVAGSIALMLQANPNMTVAQVEARLKEKARKDASTGNPPNVDVWGAGKLNVYDAFHREGRLIFDRDATDFVTLSKINYYNANAIPGGIARYQARIDYDARGIEILNLRTEAPFNSPDWNPGENPIIVSDDQAGSQPQPPRDFVKLVPLLTGSKDDPRTITLTLQEVIAATGGANYAPQGSLSYTWRRGDARADGVITIVDALFIAQYLARIQGRDLGDDSNSAVHTLVHPINAASVRHDGGLGDKVTIQDAMFIAQMLVDLRNSYYELTGLGLRAAQAARSRTMTTLSNTTVEVESATLPPGGTGQIPITVKNISDGLGLGSYDFKVTFNPEVIRVNAVNAGAFASPTKTIDNINGQVLLNAFQSAIPGPTGDVVVAYLVIGAVGGSGSSTPLNITITTLSNSDDGAIPATDVDGTVTIQ